MADAATPDPDALRALLAGARARLAGVPREALGELVVPKLFAAARAPRVVPRGTAWRLGVLLLTDDAVLATGDVVRAHDPGRRGYTAQASRERAEWGAAALRGGFREGDVVHVGWSILDLDALAAGEASGPLLVREGAALVRWSPSGGYVPLGAYLDERIDLRVHPPQGA